jgi:hypothetical protein
MTFLQIQNEVILTQFNDTQRASIKQWINDRYAEVWGLEDWTFRHAEASATVTASVPAISGVTDVGIVKGLWRDDGTELKYLPVRDFNGVYLAPAGQTGSPEAFKVVNGVVTLGPTPGTSASYTLWYERKLTQLVGDNDVPALPVEYHAMLVDGAVSLGGVRMKDFTYQFTEQRWQNAIQGMRRDYLADVRVPGRQWGMVGV